MGKLCEVIFFISLAILQATAADLADGNNFYQVLCCIWIIAFPSEIREVCILKCIYKWKLFLSGSFKCVSKNWVVVKKFKIVNKILIWIDEIKLEFIQVGVNGSNFKVKGHWNETESF